METPFLKPCPNCGENLDATVPMPTEHWTGRCRELAQLQRAAESLVEQAIEGGHIMRDPSPTVRVERMADGTPHALIAATLVGRVVRVPGVLTPPAAEER